MSRRSEKVGRPRRYAFEALEEIAHPRAAYYLAALDELSARHFDLLDDLPAEVLGWAPAPGWFSAAQITAHMIQAEGFWVSHVTRQALPDDVARPLAAWRKAEGPPATAGDLAAIGARVREEITQARLAGAEDIDGEVLDGPRRTSIRGVLLHLMWHWTYHSGQVGLIRGLTGMEYQWTFDDRIVGSEAE
ncbi:MAG TPA: DinB family protein [Phycisphaerae bacterium]|nr:DinB family protein [Phycisphaerae bacterium]